MKLVINTVIEYISDNGEKHYERVLWLEVETDKVVVYKLGCKNEFPIIKKLSDLQAIVDNKLCNVIEYRSERLLFDEHDISEAEKKSCDKAWNIIKDIVNKEPEVYNKKNRAILVKEAVQKHSTYKNYVYRKLRAYWEHGKTKNALLTGNFNKGGKGKEREPGKVKRGRPYKHYNCNNIGMNVNADIKRKFIKAYKKHYNQRNKRTLKSAYYKMLQEEFGVGILIDDKGKALKMRESIEIPSYSSFKYWYPKLCNIVESTIKREGIVDFEQNHKAVIGESTSEAYYPASIFQVDATIADIYLVSRDNRDWIIGRPVVYIIIDVFSRYITGFYVGLEGPSWVGAMMALYNTCRDKVELCKEYGINIEKGEWCSSGLPDTLIVDRGELASTKPYNLINNLGVNIKVLPPYKANWKGIVEQCFRKFNNKTLHWLVGTVPRDFKSRIDSDYRKEALLNLYEFTQIIIYSILFFNKTHMDYYKKDEQMLNENVSAKPAELWKWGIERRGGIYKTFSDDVIKLNLMPTDYARITYRGLEYKNMRFSNSDDIATGLYEYIRKYGSKRVKISYDPRDLRYVYINEGLTYKKYTNLDKGKNNLFEEEVSYQVEQKNLDSRTFESQKIADTVELNQKIDIISKKAKHEVNTRLSSKNKSVKGIRENRKMERDAVRNEEGWELNKNGSSDGKLVGFKSKQKKSDSYIAPPSYIEFIEENE